MTENEKHPEDWTPKQKRHLEYLVLVGVIIPIGEVLLTHIEAGTSQNVFRRTLTRALAWLVPAIDHHISSALDKMGLEAKKD